MSTYSNKEEIIQGLRKNFSEVSETCGTISDEVFSQHTETQWSVAENCEHLVLSTKPVAKALKLPRLTFLVFGKSKNGSGSFDELVERYRNCLSQGGKATAEYVPKKVSLEKGKEHFLLEWDKTLQYTIQNLSLWSEKDLDKYRMPHPLLGKITVREMLFFTIYHIQHHLNAIQKLLN